jgi:putative Ca2+/H+ antiporter (TMEM165/GDT1 family)
MDLAVAVASFLLIAPVELPDKTFVATLVLATRGRPLLTWIGVGLAFFVQCMIAVSLGDLLTRLPAQPITLAAGLLFAVGAVVLWRGAGRADADEADAEEEFAGRGRVGATGLRVVGASFVVLFLAEWGDLSQLLTAGLVVRYQHPLSVFAGAWIALLLVSGIGAVAGRTLLRHVRLTTVRRIGAGVCATLAGLTLLGAAGVATPL